MKHQRGYVFQSHGAWYLQYWHDEIAGGVPRRVRANKRLCSTSECRTKSEALRRAAEFLAPINEGRIVADSSRTIGDFVEHVYLPYIREQKKPSTAEGYEHIWQRVWKARVSHIRLRDFATWNGERFMQDIARDALAAKNTLKHAKYFLSGVFVHARRQGFLMTANPMRDVSIPKGREQEETYAYSLEEVLTIVAVLPEPARSAVAVAAFGGLRRGEIRGLTWGDYTGELLYVRRSVWRGHTTEPKTTASKKPVPVIAPLRKILDARRASLDPRILAGASTASTAGAGTASTAVDVLIFPNELGRPLDLEHLARSLIRPILDANGIKWYGWHAFRRGLATNLHRLGIPDKIIQVILRKASLADTQESYIKAIPADVLAAMKALETVLEGKREEAQA